MNTTIGFNPLGPQAQINSEYPVTDLNSRLTRSNFFDGRLLTALDLTREQSYIDERLRELGRSYGSGIIQGFNAQLTTGELTISSGRALSSSGRILELNNSLSIDLNDSAAISLLNSNSQTYINRGLYAVVIQYAEQSRQLAEVFPSDLSRPAEARANTIAEGIKITLVSLTEALTQQDEFSVRETLMSNALNPGAVQINLPEDSVAIGVVAFDNHRPIWFDSELLSHPLRAEDTQQSLNEDFLRRHYQLFNDILTQLNSTAEAQTIHARDFFSTLPPAGPVPKNCINTEKGTQTYFPEHFSVSIVPVNYNDLKSILTESLTLRAIDLQTSDSQDIMILAPVAEPLYMNVAQHMEADNASDSILPAIMPLPLSAFNPQYSKASAPLSSEANHWHTILSNLAGNELYYIKRPQRAAETGVSAIVLARGAVNIKSADDDNTEEAVINNTDSATDNIISDTPSIATFNNSTANSFLINNRFATKKMAIVDENEAILRQINLPRLAKHRPPKNAFEQKALDKLIAIKAKDSQFILGIMDTLILIERHYDSSLWRTLLQLAEKGDIKLFVQSLTKALQGKNNTAEIISLSSKDTGLPLTNSLKKQWLKLSEEA